MSREAFEINYDGLVGPTHSFGGLSYGNIASMQHRCLPSNPKAAVLQGLKKMKLLHDLGVRQAVLPPHERPYFPMLRKKGYRGSDADILEKVGRDDPRLLLAAYSASSMWAANAATISPSSDTNDGRVHITPANLHHQSHRSIETSFTRFLLKRIFRDDAIFVHHPPLANNEMFGDEGAANHMRLCQTYGSEGFELFIYGREAALSTRPGSSRFPARQTKEASTTVARRHGLHEQAVLFIQQHPHLIDAGVFHNDVISVSNKNLLFFHEEAFVGGENIKQDIQNRFTACCGGELRLAEVPSSDLSAEACITSYLFNSQLVTLPNDTQCFIAPIGCSEDPKVKSCIDRLRDQDHLIDSVQFVDLTQSMMNGGGPACLRLRMVLTEEELAHTHTGIILDGRLYRELVAWAEKYYREDLSADDLVDIQFVEECRHALDDLTTLLQTGPIYSFQG